MKRRIFLGKISLSVAGLSLLPACKGVKAPPSEGPSATSFVLSQQGCGRATGYAEANKIISIGQTTHVSWLDSSMEGFRVRIRSYNRQNGTWSPTFTVGEAYDNHGGPALTVDSKGYLHVVYYPHHHEMRYRRSRRPNDASDWEEEIFFGEGCTYPTLLCGPDDTLYFTCRRQLHDAPWQVELWTKAPGRNWQRQSAILQARFTGYAHFQESLAWSPDRKQLHLSCRIHEKTDDEGYGKLQTVGYMTSADYGRTWTRSDGTPINLPATAETIERLESGGVEKDKILRAGGMAVDASGKPHLLYSIQENDKGETMLASPNGNGQWRRILLSEFLPEKFRGWDMIMPGGISFNEENEMFIAAQIQMPRLDESSWGHPSTEIILLRSADHGKSFRSEVISSATPHLPNWLPNIERVSGHHLIPDRPAVIFTAGAAGKGLQDQLSNGVVFVG